MNRSDAFSDYMVSYSVNRSINLSPTLGRLHKHKQPSSFGPTICLMNRSRQKIEESTTLDEKQEQLLCKILMLSFEIEKLTEQNRRLKSQKEEWSTIDKLRQKSMMRQQNQKLRKSVQKNQLIWKEQQKKYNGQIYELKQKNSDVEAENRTLNRRLKENQKEIEEMLIKGRINQSMAQRAKMEASRMQMSMHINSTNIDLQKSFAKEKNMEIDSLRDKIMRCQEIIKDQKFIISGQKQQINKERAKQNEVENRYSMEIDFLRKQLNFTQNQNAQINQEQIKKLQTQIRDWQSRVVRSEEQLKDKCLIIANQVKTINQQEDRCLELQRKLQDLQFANHSRIIRAEEAVKLANKEKERETKKLFKEVQKYLEEIETLKITIEHYKQNIAQKDLQVHQATFEMSNKLKQKEQQVKRLRRRDKQQLSQTKMNKSLSVDNFAINNRLKASQVSLQQIVSSVVELKNSHDRSTRLIQKTFIAKEDYYGH